MSNEPLISQEPMASEEPLMSQEPQEPMMCEGPLVSSEEPMVSEEPMYATYGPPAPPAPESEGPVCEEPMYTTYGPPAPPSSESEGPMVCEEPKYETYGPPLPPKFETDAKSPCKSPKQLCPDPEEEKIVRGQQIEKKLDQAGPFSKDDEAREIVNNLSEDELRDLPPQTRKRLKNALIESASEPNYEANTEALTKLSKTESQDGEAREIVNDLSEDELRDLPPQTRMRLRDALESGPKSEANDEALAKLSKTESEDKRQLDESVEYEKNVDKEVEELYAQLKVELDKILEIERKEAQDLEQSLQKNDKVEEYAKALARGILENMKSSAELGFEILHRLPISPLAGRKWTEDLKGAKKIYDKLAAIPDEDIQAVWILLQDPPTYYILYNFAKDYIATQHSLEWTETVGPDVIIAILTGGAGVLSNARHLTKLTKLRGLLQKLVQVLKRQKTSIKKGGARDSSKGPSEKGTTQSEAELSSPPDEISNQFPESAARKTARAKADAAMEKFDPDTASNKQKGNFGEMKMDDFIESKGPTRLGDGRVTDLNQKLQKGIDGVYEVPKHQRPPKYIIAESKYGKSTLNTKTSDGKQMSDPWVYGSSERLDKVVGKEKAREIRRELRNNPNPDNVVQKVLVKVDETGKVTMKTLDADGNVIGDFKFKNN